MSLVIVRLVYPLNCSCNNVQVYFVVLWVMIPCILVHCHQRFGGKYWLHLQSNSMEEVGSSDTLVKTTRCHNPQNHNPHFHHRENPVGLIFKKNRILCMCVYVCLCVCVCVCVCLITLYYERQRN
jgi:hypothetical protein